VLGHGAMGEVYEAHHTQTGAPAAVKLLRRELLSEARHVERFVREVQVASAIDSPHVVRVLEAATPHDGLPFLAMERLRGKTLAELLRGQGTLTHGGVIGTPAYMSPEQARGEPVDHRADVYALGAVIYRCVTGRVPFSAGDTPSLLHAVLHDMPLRPSAIARVDADLERVILLALARSRDARLASVAELVAAFEAATTGALPTALVRRADALARDQPWTEPR